MNTDRIKDDEMFSVQIDGESIELKQKIFENGKLLSELFIPAVASAEFSDFKQNLKNKDYTKVYSSEVFKSITELYNDNNIIYLEPETKLLRARIVRDINEIYQEKNGIHFENEILRGYDLYNSKEPAIGLSTEGRANSRYSSYFYCANDGPTAASEIKPNIGDYISLALFVVKRKLKLIELKHRDLFDGKTKKECHFNIIGNHFSVPVSDSSEYFLTQFISDELRKYGIDGICYKSHFTHKNNYVIFNCSMDTIEFINSKIIQLRSQQLNFVDFSAEKMLSTKAIPDLDKDEIQREKNHIYGMIQSIKYENETDMDFDNGGENNG